MLNGEKKEVNLNEKANKSTNILIIYIYIKNIINSTIHFIIHYVDRLIKKPNKINDIK